MLSLPCSRLRHAAKPSRRNPSRASDQPPRCPPGRRPMSTRDSNGARASGDPGADADLDEFRTEAHGKAPRCSPLQAPCALSTRHHRNCHRLAYTKQPPDVFMLPHAVEQDPERWYDPVPAASLGDSGGSAVPIEAEPVNVEEGVPPATAPVGQDAVNPWGMSAGQHTQPWRFQADQPQPSTAADAATASSSGRRPALGPSGEASSSSGHTEPAPVPGRGPVRLGDGADARFKDTAFWRALCAVWWFVQKVNTTVIALLWVAFLLFATVYVGAYVVKYVQLVVLRSAAGSAGIIASGGLA